MTDEQEVKSTTISVTLDTKEKLDKIKEQDETYNSAINKAVSTAMWFGSEKEFHKWFEKNYAILGFDEVVESNMNKFPDLILKSEGKIIRVELETYASNFIRHMHNPDNIDLVICLIKDIELPVKTIQVPNLYLDETQTIVLRKGTRAELDKFGTRHESYNSIIRKLIDAVNKSQKSGVSGQTATS